MRDINRRVKNVEKKLNLNKKPITIRIIDFGGGGELPPDRTEGNITYHHVMYEEIVRERNKKQQNQTKRGKNE